MIAPLFERILILRPDGIGDCVIFSAALQCIRETWPRARLDLMVRPPVRPLFELCPHIDRLLSTHRLMPWETCRRHFVRGTWRLQKLLLSAPARRGWYPRYDLVLYPVSAPSEDWLEAVRLLEAGEKWGFGGEQLRLWDLADERNRPERVFTRFHANTAENRWQHEFDRSGDFLTAVGIDASGMAPAVWLSEADGEAAGRLLPPGAPLGFFIGAGSRWRKWPGAKWVELGRQCGSSPGIVLLGALEDREDAGGIAAKLSQAGVPVTDLCGRTSLRVLAATINRCSALVSNDSCGLHLAVAQGVPAVGILGGYHFGRYYPWGDGRIHRVANRSMACYHCNDDCKHGDWRCVSDVPVETVLRELKALASIRADDDTTMRRAG